MSGDTRGFSGNEAHYASLNYPSKCNSHLWEGGGKGGGRHEAHSVS